MRSWRTVMGVAGSGFMVLSAFAHGAGGWPVQRAALTAAETPPDLIRAMAAGWLFGSVAMAIFGILGLRASWRVWRGNPESPWPMRIVGLGYAAFGIAAILAQRGNWFFLVFVIPGLLTAWAAPRSRRTDPAAPPARR